MEPQLVASRTPSGHKEQHFAFPSSPLGCATWSRWSGPKRRVQSGYKARPAFQRSARSVETRFRIMLVRGDLAKKGSEIIL